MAKLTSAFHKVV